MKNSFIPSDNCYAIIKESENCKLVVYQTVFENGKKDIPTVGWGHTNRNLIVGAKITQLQAVIYLNEDMKIAASNVNRLVTSNINQNMFDALCSLCFNVGYTELATSKLLAKVNINPFDEDAIRPEFENWVYSQGNKLKGLIIRRDKEANLYFKE